MLRIYSKTLPQAQHTFNLPAGDYSGLFVRISGTNAASQTLAVTDLGTVLINYNSRQIYNVTPEVLLNLTNLYYGTPENSSTTGAAFAFSFFVPFRTKFDNVNVLRALPDRVQFILNNMNTSKISSGTIEVYALVAKGVPQYVPIFKNQDMSFAGAATLPLEIAQSNVSALYIVHDANISRIHVLRDGQTIVSGDWAAIDGFSDATNRVETGINLVEVFAPKSDLISESINREISGEITSSAAITTLKLAFFAIELANQPAR